MKKPAYSFQDLIVYQNLYQAMIIAMNEIIPKLPSEERFDLVSQIRRCCKAPLAIIAEGYAKKHHEASWRKYINDAIGECNEMINHLSIAKDIYKNFIDVQLCESLIKTYNIAGKQLYRLGQSWSKPTSHPHNLTHSS